MMRLFVAMSFGFCLLAQTEGLLERADEAFRQGDSDRAASLARQVLARQPRAVHAHMILGIIAAQKNQWEASDKHFQAVARLEPSNPYGYFYLGQARLYQQRWEQAIRYFTQALERGYPERERLIVEMALAQNEAGRPREALAGLHQISAPADTGLAAQYYSVTALVRGRLSEFGPAIDAMRRAVELDDANPNYWDFLIDTLIKTDQAPQALAEAIRAQKKFPDHPDIQLLFALASYYVTDSPLGKLALRNVREAEPESPRVLLAEGLLHRKDGRNEEAFAAFQQAASRGVPDAHLLLGLLLRERGDYSGAEREYREAERVNPDNGQVLLELAKLLSARGDLEGALERLKKAVDSMPSVAPVHYQLGLVYRRLGQKELADRHLRLSRQLQAAQGELIDSGRSESR